MADKGVQFPSGSMATTNSQGTSLDTGNLSGNGPMASPSEGFNSTYQGKGPNIQGGQAPGGKGNLVSPAEAGY